MIRVRRLPLEFTAEEWFPESPVAGVDYPGKAGTSSLVFTAGSIETLEGRHVVSPGDWIVTGINGEKWAVKPDIFWKTYEEVDD